LFLASYKDADIKIFPFCTNVKLGLLPREGHPLLVFENRVQSKIFGKIREEVKEKRRKLHDEKLLDS
jgi:hypothetical protein